MLALIATGKDFLNKTVIAQALRSITDKWVHIKLPDRKNTNI